MKKVLFLLLSVTALTACEKNGVNDEFASMDVKPIFDQCRRHFDEAACIVNNKAGIKCYESIGKTCKKAHPCTVVTDLDADVYFTQEELNINNWLNVDLESNRDFIIHMWEEGWFYHPDTPHVCDPPAVP